MLVLFIVILVSLRTVVLFSKRSEYETNFILRRFLVLLVSLVMMYNVPVGNSLAASLSPRSFAEKINEEVKDASLYSFGNEFYGISFYLGKKIDRLEDSRPKSGDYVLLYMNNLPELQKTSQLTFKSRSDNSIVKTGKKVLLMKIN